MTNPIKNETLGLTPEFTWRALHIAYNVEGEDVALHIDPEDGTTIHGILTMLGFTPENGRIEGCTFFRDEALAPGSMRIRPLK